MLKRSRAATAEPSTPPEASPPLPEVPRDPLELGSDPVRHVEPRLAARSFPYRPDTALDGGLGHGLVVRAASVRGRTKRFQGSAREDDFCLMASAARAAIVVAVADGMGSAKRSGLGAALAVRHAVEAIEEQLSERSPEKMDWPQIFNRAASALVVEHRRETGGENLDRPDHDETRAVSRDLGTTLTLAVVEARENREMDVIVAAIGDSPAFKLANGAYELLAGERETDEDFSTSTVVALPYLPQPEIRSLRLAADEVLLICTDGFSGPLSAGNSDVGRLFIRELASPPSLSGWSYLLDFAKATYDDDRTLVAIWPAESPTPDPGAATSESG
jgi:serine/threonine protein phosphatase PrpC